VRRASQRPSAAIDPLECRHLRDVSAARAFDREDFYDFQHMTPRGTAKVGDALFEALNGRL